jgi:hypothetical protein
MFQLHRSLLLRLQLLDYHQISEHPHVFHIQGIIRKPSSWNFNALYYSRFWKHQADHWFDVVYCDNWLL